MPLTDRYKPEPHHQELGPEFFDIVEVAKFPKHTVRFRNGPWSKNLGFDQLTDDEWIKYFAKFEPLPGNLEMPLSLRYHGHQFRVYNPDLGDGRGFLYAQMREPAPSPDVTARLLDFGTKGSGQTPWSRQGDGRLTLKGAVREILATEMLEALGVNTSKTFSVIETGEQLQRNDEPSPTRSAVLVRLCHSHIRFGTFQRFAFLDQKTQIEQLLNYSTQYYYPEIHELPVEKKIPEFLKLVAHNSGVLAAQWMTAGFVHGVLNTDNLNITGESFDYGPYRFLPHYDPQFTAAYFDHSGLYAYGRQPNQVLWSLERLAECFTLFTHDVEMLAEALKPFIDSFHLHMRSEFLRRLQLQTKGAEKDENLLESAIYFLIDSEIDYQQFFFDWYGGTLSEERARSGIAKDHYQGERFEQFRNLLASFEPANQEATLQKLGGEYFRQAKPENMLIDEVEELWAAIDQRDDWQPFYDKIERVRKMGQIAASDE